MREDVALGLRNAGMVEHEVTEKAQKKSLALIPAGKCPRCGRATSLVGCFNLQRRDREGCSVKCVINRGY